VIEVSPQLAIHLAKMIVHADEFMDGVAAKKPSEFDIHAFKSELSLEEVAGFMARMESMCLLPLRRDGKKYATTPTQASDPQEAEASQDGSILTREGGEK
jgi:hypothetical protein